MSSVSPTSFPVSAPTGRSQANSSSEASTRDAPGSAPERPFAEALRNCCEESPQQKTQAKSKTKQADCSQSGGEPRAKEGEPRAKEGATGRSDSAEVSEEVELDSEECCDGTAPAMYLSMPLLPQLTPAELSAAPLLPTSPVAAADVATAEPLVRVSVDSARVVGPNLSEAARAVPAPVDAAVAAAAQPKGAPVAPNPVAAAAASTLAALPTAESAGQVVDAPKLAAAVADAPKLVAGKSAAGESLAAAGASASAKEITARVAPAVAAPAVAAAVPAATSSTGTAAPVGGPALAAEPQPAVASEGNKLPTAEPQPAAARPDRTAAASASGPVVLPQRERAAPAPASAAALVQPSTAGVRPESLADLANGGGRQSQQQPQQSGSDRFGFGAAKDSAGANRSEAGIAGSSLGAAATSSDSLVQKAENLRVFIHRIESSVQQMKQQGSSSLQMRITLEQGQVIRIRLNLRGTQLKTFIQTDSESIRSLLKEGWSDLSRILADKGVSANNPEFESGMNQSGGQGSEQEAAFEQMLQGNDLSRAAARVAAESPLVEPPAQPVHNSLPKQSFSRIA